MGFGANPVPDGESQPVVTRQIAAEAAVWVARLHGPSRSPQMESQFRKWLALSAAHRLAFERCTDVWEAVPGITVADAFEAGAGLAAEAAAARERWWHRGRRALWVVLAVVAAASAFLLNRWLTVDSYETTVGEQRHVTLADGSRMSLNTQTRVRVAMDSARRTVQLEAGEAIFEVAKDPLRPFVVRVGSSEVIAVGTVFSVRFEKSISQLPEPQLAVVLIEGEVTVRPDGVVRADAKSPPSQVTMRPGERLRVSRPAEKPGAPAVAQVDRPAMEPLVAWRRGEVIFDDVSLADAVIEMNRYTRTPIVLQGDAARLRVSGSYHTGDSQGFAALAALHGLAVREHDGTFQISRPH
jgi:transmembrane sensor